MGKRPSKTIKKLFIILFPLFLFFCLCGCQGLSGKSPNQRSVAQLMALDLAQDDSQGSPAVLLTLRVLDEEGSPEGPETFQTVQAQGKSITDALGDISRQLGKDIFLRDVRVILFGESLCQNGIDNCQKFLSQSYQIRPRVSIAAAEGEAARLFQDDDNGEAPIDSITSLLEWDNRPGNSAVTVMELERIRSSSEGDCILPFISLGDEKKAEISGSAVFTGGQLKIKLDNTDTKDLRFLSADPRQIVLTVSLPDNCSATFRLTGRKGRIYGGNQDGAPLFRLKYHFEFQLLEFTGNTKIPSLENMEKALEQTVNDAISHSIQKVVFDGDADIMGLASAMRRDSMIWWNQFGSGWKTFMDVNSQDSLFQKSVFILDTSCKIAQSDIRVPISGN